MSAFGIAREISGETKLDRNAAEAAIELENYAKYISEIDFDLSSGKFNVSDFAGHLYHCLVGDRNKTAPQPEQVFSALKELTDTHIPKGTPGLSFERVSNWTPAMAEICPNGLAIMIHVAGLIYVQAEWIHAIGRMVEDRAADPGRSYLAWPRSEWHLTNTLLQRFHRQFWSLMRETDMKSTQELNCSQFEALSLAMRSGIDYEAAIKRLQARNTGFVAAIARIGQAIEAGYPLEAITICESLISSCLHHFLEAAGEAQPPEIFAQLIGSFRQVSEKAQGYPAELVEEIDEWRRARNEAMHRFVARNPAEIARSQQEFLDDAVKTAADGKDICSKVVAWFHNESFYFLKTEFELPRPPLN